MDKPIPEPIRPLLQNYLQLLVHHTPDLAAACYLHGSIALNAFNERLSGIDFLTVLHRSPTSQEIMHLQAIHKSLTTTYPHWRLDGSYIQWHDVGRLPDAIAPCPYVLRDEPEHKFYKFHIRRAWDAVKFLHYIIQLCNDQVRINSH